jgi:hypothetical protein
VHINKYMWYYNNEIYKVDSNAEMKTYPYYGFVYLITNETNGKRYVGKKFFWSKKTLGITKTRKRKKILYVQSDWVTYTGSSRQLNEDIDAGHSIKKEILHLCQTKGICAYLETKEHFERDVLLTDDYYNGIISAKIGGPSVRLLREDNTRT